MCILQPSEARTFAVDLPMPELEALTNATFPLRSVTITNMENAYKVIQFKKNMATANGL